MQNNEKESENANAPLIRVELNTEGQSVVSARELHAFLEVQTRFDKWITRMFKYDFKEGRDFNSVKIDQVALEGTRQVKREVIDYALTISCAKEIAMLQRNEKGKQARQYFLECEEQLKAIQQNLVTQEQFDKVMKLVQGNFSKIGNYVFKMERELEKCLDIAEARLEKTEKRLEILEANQIQDKTTLTDTTQRVDKIEEHLDFKSVACVYVMYCPHRKLHKFGSSHDAKGRKKQFSVVYANLEIVYEIPTISRDEAYTLENAVKKRFKKKHVEGEWYALEPEDLEYLYEQQQNNKKHLANMA